MLRQVCSALLVTTLACDAPPASAPIGVQINLPVTRFVLANGLEVYVQEDHRVPRVAVNVTYHVGSKDDPPGRAGMAHLVEHLQFTGSEHTAPDSFFNTINDLGAKDINGETIGDVTQYFETVPAESLDATLWIEADRMASAKLGWPDAMIKREKNVVGQELRLRYRNEPNGFWRQLLSRAVYPVGHPYRQSLDEEAQERASTSDELRELARRYYAPDNATIMLVGDVTTDHAKELVGRHFGGIAPCPGCRPARLIQPVARAALKRMRVLADVDAPAVYVAWPLPAPGADGYYEEAYALSEVEANARDYTENPEGLRAGGKKTMRPRSVGWLLPFGGRLGMIGAIYGTPTADGRPEDLVDGIDVARRHIVAYEWSDMSAQESTRVVNEIKDVEALGDRARRMQAYREEFGDPAYVMKDLYATSGVTKSRMLGAVDHFFDLERATLVIVTPDHDAPRAGKVVEEVPR